MEKKVNGMALALTFLITSIITFSLKDTFNHQWILIGILILLGFISIIGIFSEVSNILEENKIKGLPGIIFGILFSVLFVIGIKKIGYDIIKVVFIPCLVLSIYLTFDGILNLSASISNKSDELREKFKIKDMVSVITKLITVVLSTLQILKIFSIIK